MRPTAAAAARGVYGSGRGALQHSSVAATDPRSRVALASVSTTAADAPMTRMTRMSKRQFSTTSELMTNLRSFTAVREASLSNSCQIQVQMTLAANKAAMDVHHGNGFAKDFLEADGMSEVLKLFYHPDKHVHEAAFGLARALCQQRWVARQMVQKQLVARIVPLTAAQRPSRRYEACKLVAQLLSQGQQGGFDRDVATQIVGNGGLQTINTSLETRPHETLGQASVLLEGVAAAGSACRHQLVASEALTALATASSAVLCRGVQKNKPPVTPADLPDLHRASNALFAIAKAAVRDGPTSTALFISSGASGAMLQMQTPWLTPAKRQWQLDSIVPLRIISEQHPANMQTLLDATPIPFAQGTSPLAWLSWRTHIATELGIR